MSDFANSSQPRGYKSTTRRVAIAMLATLSSMVTMSSAQAQAAYPSKPIQLVVPYGAGTGTDAMARRLSSVMQGQLGQPMIVEDKPGGMAQIGSQAVARSAPDGHTLLMATDQVMCFNPVLIKNLSYNATRDFTPVAGISYHPYILVVPSSLPVRNVAELVALAKAKPGTLSYASTGIATSAHIVGEVFKQEAKIDISHVPYQAGAQLFPDLVEGRVHMLFYPYQLLKPYIDTGKLRVLASTTERRVTWLRDLPTMPELGYARTVMGAWMAIYAPAGTPADRVARLTDAFKKALQMPDVGGPLPELGIDVTFRTPTELTAFAAAELNRCQDVVKISGAKLD